MNSNTWCAISHVGLSVHNGGHVSICNGSKKLLLNQNNELLLLNQDSLIDAWNSKTRLEIQQALDSGIKHENCTDCWRLEEAGLQSFRLIHNNTFRNCVHDKNQPAALFLKPGNLCNLACRHCDPQVSTGWYRDYYQANIDNSTDYRSWLKKFAITRSSYSSDNQNVWPIIKNWLPGIYYFDLYGAEPLLIDSLLELLKESVDKKYSQNQTIHVNTNGTVWKDEFQSIFSQFKNTNLDISIDGIEQQFDYMRYPANWDTVKCNIKKYQSITNASISVTVTVSIYNIWYLNSIMKYFSENNINVSINILHQPDEFCIRNLPDEIKQQITNHLLVEERSYIIDNIVSFMNMPGDNLLDKFLSVTKKYDLIRNQQFSDVFPEFYNIIKPNE